MKSSIRILTVMAVMLSALLASPARCGAQKVRPGVPKGGSEVLHYIVEGNDTIFVDEIKASKVYSRLPKQKGKDWRRYYRLVHNFSKTYPQRPTLGESSRR